MYGPAGEAVQRPLDRSSRGRKPCCRSMSCAPVLAWIVLPVWSLALLASGFARSFPLSRYGAEPDGRTDRAAGSAKRLQASVFDASSECVSATGVRVAGAFPPLICFISKKRVAPRMPSSAPTATGLFLLVVFMACCLAQRPIRSVSDARASCLSANLSDRGAVRCL